MKFSTRSQYGLRAMVFLAKQPGVFVPLKEISVKEHISFDYLEKILTQLKKAGLVEAKKGVTGGYCLKRHSQKTKVGEIIRALEGEMALVKCLGLEKKFACPQARKCLTRSLWKKIQEAVNSSLNSITLSELIPNKNEKT